MPMNLWWQAFCLMNPRIPRISHSQRKFVSEFIKCRFRMFDFWVLCSFHTFPFTTRMVQFQCYSRSGNERRYYFNNEWQSHECEWMQLIFHRRVFHLFEPYEWRAHIRRSARKWNNKTSRKTQWLHFVNQRVRYANCTLARTSNNA